ncbi:hypothetical protein [Nocardia paucivorans]|uniref:hypothetical protein n=1 Tax=Nocardia paucivorans TaxID=114259 RepID=UPI000594D59B|nr:hypothetical protein [Nocardia paucivorans]
MNKWENISTEELQELIEFTASSAVLKAFDVEALSDLTGGIAAKRNKPTDNAETLRGIVRFALGDDIADEEQRKAHQRMFIENLYAGIEQEDSDLREIEAELNRRESGSEDSQSSDGSKWSEYDTETLVLMVTNEQITYRVTESDRLGLDRMIDGVKRLQRRQRALKRRQSGTSRTKRVTDSVVFRVLIRIAAGMDKPREERLKHMDFVTDQIIKVLAAAAREQSDIKEELSMRAMSAEEETN